ncbi:MAG: [FeFe] hydrogenase, group A [Patescibacteria group bacterium]
MFLKINNKKFPASLGQTILEIALENGFTIPTLCNHPDLDVRASCRVCVVEIKGKDKLQAACSTLAEEGMEIQIDSPRVQKSRDLNLKMLFASHVEKCIDCNRRFNCTLLNLARTYKIKITSFPDRKIKRKTYKFANAVEIDGTQCIDCGNCIQACDRQNIHYLHIEGNGSSQEIKPNKNNNSACINCGQCTNVCPVAAAEEQGEWKQVEAALKDDSKVVVAQFAPAVRVSLGEEFGIPYGTNCAKKINTALKVLGFNHVFDINFGADITTMTEADELIERLNNKKAIFPMMTSCCPAWVSYAELYHPELLPNLTTARSPHIHSAGAIKSYFSKEKKISSKKIVVVSIVPCTAKKYEAVRPELKYKGRPLVDHVLTTREFAFILKKNKIDFKSLSDSETESIFNDGSGAAAIYGASGGVMESALRTAISLACKANKNKLCASRLEFKEVRGLKGFKEASVNLAGHQLKVGVVNGIGNFEAILPKLKKYHYIEVMACSGGCLGGGGQPIPTTDAIRKKRLEGMYSIDSGKKVRRAHENKPMVEYYEWVKKHKLSANLLHTKFSFKKR